MKKKTWGKKKPSWKAIKILNCQTIKSITLSTVCRTQLFHLVEKVEVVRVRGDWKTFFFWSTFKLIKPLKEKFTIGWQRSGPWNFFGRKHASKPLSIHFYERIQPICCIMYVTGVFYTGLSKCDSCKNLSYIFLFKPRFKMKE